MKSIKVLLCLVVVLTAAVLARPASAATRLGGISVQSACDHQYGTGLVAELYGKTVLNWYCTFKSGKYIMGRNSVDLSRECRRVYGSYTYAAYTNYYNPYSWGCYR